MTGAPDHTGDWAGIYVQVYASTAYALLCCSGSQKPNF